MYKIPKRTKLLKSSAVAVLSLAMAFAPATSAFAKDNAAVTEEAASAQADEKIVEKLSSAVFQSAIGYRFEDGTYDIWSTVPCALINEGYCVGMQSALTAGKDSYVYQRALSSKQKQYETLGININDFDQVSSHLEIRVNVDGQWVKAGIANGDDTKSGITILKLPSKLDKEYASPVASNLSGTIGATAVSVEGGALAWKNTDISPNNGDGYKAGGVPTGTVFFNEDGEILGIGVGSDKENTVICVGDTIRDALDAVSVSYFELKDGEKQIHGFTNLKEDDKPDEEKKETESESTDVSSSPEKAESNTESVTSEISSGESAAESIQPEPESEAESASDNDSADTQESETEETDYRAALARKCAEHADEDLSEYTDESVEQYQTAVKNGEALLLSEYPEDEEMADAIKEIDEAYINLERPEKSSGDGMSPFITILVAVVAAIAAAALAMSKKLKDLGQGGYSGVPKKEKKTVRFKKKKDDDDDGDNGGTSVLEEKGKTGSTSLLNAPYLIRRSNDEKIELEDGFTIGKEKGRVDYAITDNNTVSRQHAKFLMEGTRWYIEDLGSLNGTYVNDEQVEEEEQHEVKPGDKIVLSDVEFTFKQ